MNTLSTISEYLIILGFCALLMMVVVYLWETVHAAHSLRQQSVQTSAVIEAEHILRQEHADSASGVTVLVRNGVQVPVPPLSKVAIMGSVTGWLVVGMLLTAQILRTIIAQHAPWSNLYEFGISFTTALLLCYLIFEAIFGEKVRSWGLLVCVFSLVTMSVAIAIGLAYNLLTPTRQLIPALQDQTILTVHVATAIFAYALFTVAFGAGMVILLQGGKGQKLAWLPSAETADMVSYRAVTIAFPLLALTLILGAYWANKSWGHYWSWDPKETSALVTWLIYAAYLHARGIRGWRGMRIGWFLVVGFAAVLFTYYAVSFLVPGLHSYAVPVTP